MKQMSFFEPKARGDSFREICESLGVEGGAPAWPDLFGRQVRRYLEENGIPAVRTLSLFSGAGGLDIGFSDAGFDIIEAVEIERKFCETLVLNSGEGKQFQDAKVNCVDIRDYSGKNLEKIDFIIGGPPCQTFSAAGRRANGVLGTADARGILFREYVRLLKRLNPAGFLFENVYGIIGAQGGKAWEDIRASFSAVGYRLFYKILDAADYGVPQHRERLIIVGLKRGAFAFPRPTHGPDSCDGQPFYNAETAIAGVELSEEEAAPGIGGRYGELLNDIPPGLNYSFYTEEMGHPKPVFAWRSKFSDFLYKADPKEPIRTIKASCGAYTGPFHWENRPFACPEYKRLQTFPDAYQISGAKPVVIRQIGNSVPPQMARMLAIAIRQQVFHTKFPFSLPLLKDGEELSFGKRKRGLTAAYKKKAQAAIGALTREKGTRPSSRTYYCVLDSGFDYKEAPEEGSTHRIEARWSDNLYINVSDLQGGAPKKRATITIRPRNAEWSLGVSEVVISIRSGRGDSFTVGWKAFEQELVSNDVKADLVQLNGYYQYSPKLSCTYTSTPRTDFDAILQGVVGGECVGSLFATESLAEKWGVPSAGVMRIAEKLRALGYEIRNHNTNPQIDEGKWLLPYAFPTLTKASVQLRKQVRRMDDGNQDKGGEIHLTVYGDRSELHLGDRVMVYREGFQNAETQRRYEQINSRLSNGYLEERIGRLEDMDFSGLSDRNKALLRDLVEGITSETGRALAGVALLQLAVKAIAPAQSVRLHKGTARRGSFSWVEGISMRTIDSSYITPFLRKYGLLNVNKYGVFMTRSLAENYPYSKLYKAEMRGPFDEWIDIVDALEDNSMPAELGLCYLMALLKNRSDSFREKADQAIALAAGHQRDTFGQIEKLLIRFFNETGYSARAFEVVMHGLMQALQGLGLLGGCQLIPMSQMRSANKKHGNIGDIELAEGRVIVEAWDAKYGKPYLRDELEELEDKILASPGVKIAGFVVDREPDRRREITARADEIAGTSGVQIKILSFEEWVDWQIGKLLPSQLDAVGYQWLLAVVESFGQRRTELAPIDEPCEAWIDDLTECLK